MDHFFTAIEEREHPEIKGQPVIVGADPKEGKGRGVVSTCNYAARKFGMRSGMPISKAWRLCPQAVYLPVNYAVYEKVSNEIMQSLRKYADKFEQWGIDEAFLDVTSRTEDYAEAENLARQIKADIKKSQQLTCSIGIGPNKLVAKIASDFQKPDGLTTVEEREVQRFLRPLSVRKLLWVGRKTEEKLHNMSINTVGDLAQVDPTILIEAFGSFGTQFYLSAQGIDRSEVEERTGVKSISRETTFQEDTADHSTILEAINDLAMQVCDDALKQRLHFKTVTIKVRYENFETHTHSKTLPFITNRPQDLKKVSAELLMPSLEADRKVRLVGVRIASLVSAEKQKTLA